MVLAIEVYFCYVNSKVFKLLSLLWSDIFCRSELSKNTLKGD